MTSLETPKLTVPNFICNEEVVGFHKPVSVPPEKWHMDVPFTKLRT